METVEREREREAEHMKKRERLFYLHDPMVSLFQLT